MLTEFLSETADGAVVLRFPGLASLPFLAHCVTTRFTAAGGTTAGGTTAGGEFNLAFHVENDPPQTLRNRRILCGAFGLPLERLTCCRQAHGPRVALVDESAIGRGAASDGDALDGYDAMVTRVPGALLAMFSADCPLTILADPAARALGVCHSGWRGLAGGVIGATVAAMKENLGSDPPAVFAATGPSIEKACYEVGEDVAEPFALRHPKCIERKGGGKYLLDLRGVVREQLLAAGLREEKMEISRLCTKCRADLFFSHRRGDAGRFALAAAIKV